jgi:hypothetical protein
MGCFVTIPDHLQGRPAKGVKAACDAKIVNNVAKWNGTDRSAVGEGAPDIGAVFAFCEYKDELYAGFKNVMDWVGGGLPLAAASGLYGRRSSATPSRIYGRVPMLPGTNVPLVGSIPPFESPN